MHVKILFMYQVLKNKENRIRHFWRLCQKKTRHDFQACLCYDVRLFNFIFILHHPVWVEEEYKKERCFKEHVTLVREEKQYKKKPNKNTNSKKQKQLKQKTKQKTFRCDHFSDCLYFAFGEINLKKLVSRLTLSLTQICQIYLKIISSLKLLQMTVNAFIC